MTNLPKATDPLDGSRKESPASDASLSRAESQAAEFVWLSGVAFARAAGISGRAGRSILSRAARGAPWLGAELIVRQARGRGGHRGLSYEVRLDSLPDQIAHYATLETPPPSLHANQPEPSSRPVGGGTKDQPAPLTEEESKARWDDFSRLPTGVQERAKQRMEMVVTFADLSRVETAKTELYAAVAKQFGESTSSVRRAWKLVRGLDRRDWLPALAPQYRGCQVAGEISEDVKAYIWGEYFSTTKPHLMPIYRRAKRLAEEKEWTLPSRWTVARLIDAEPRWFHVMTREGRAALEALYPAQQRDYSTLALHEVWCADGRKADVFVRWEDGTISRPIVVAWLELRSRMCLGHEVGRTESADLIRLAFKRGAETSKALPREALMDNGRGFASKLLTGGAPNRFRFKVREEDVPGVLTLLGIEVIWTLPFSGRSKPIESWFRVLAELDKRFPGAYCGNRPDAKPEDCDPKKAIPIARFRAALEQAIAAYHDTPHRGDSMDYRTPRDVYDELLPQTVVRRPTADQLRLCLMAAEAVKLNKADGTITILGNRYWSEKLASLPGNVEYVVRFNPEDAADQVSVYRGSQFICEAKLIGRTGFRDQEAAKAHQRGKRTFLRVRKLEAAAIRGMSTAKAWLAPDGSDMDAALQAEVAKNILPFPKIVEPVRPETDYRHPDEEDGPTEEEFFRALFGEGRR